MKSVYALVLSLTLAVAASGCGKSLPKLTTEQKEQLGEVLASAGQAQRAVPKQSRGQGVFAHAPRTSALSILGLSTVETQSALPRPQPTQDAPQLTRPNESAMRSRLESSQCEITSSFGDGFGGVSPMPGNSRSMPPSDGMPSPSMPSMDLSKMAFDIHVKGSKCPMSMDLALKIEAQQNSANADFVWNYAVKDSEYSKLNDVTGADLKGSMKITGDSSGKSGNGDLNIKGKIVSQKHGELPVELTGTMHVDGAQSSQPKQSGEIALFIQFKDFGAELKQKMDGDKVQHFINSEEVTEQEFNSYLGKLFN